ncbi:hypothetical protein M441DRAFT_154576 [Trichoderma asperellum CBS 433.97]|uniref:FluG domain-containing protein n=1 Tax=Trichoderma asperellum (strain ATCC 204424 / CBS 433.97 / NBRC 101777) TaxID=1042311 RepID=A0A2T3YQS8_TRIA4|nr:hypothetical protein M441DRAFT_154576 [Trichoderma asperellum CBS 433.97]PTB34918.1 hypothetical protein M441DRAFT_154576 [Trichoderma asperellum CBS 433.97]WVH32729.1 hypothetical protein [Trichoderma asperellum]
MSRIINNTNANANAPPNCHIEFLQQFTVKEHARLDRPEVWTAEEHAFHRELLYTTKSNLPDHAPETRINLAILSKKWKRYCTEKLKTEDQKLAIKNIDCETLKDFITFICLNYNNKSQGSIFHYIRGFQQLYRLASGEYMNRNDSEEVYRYYRTQLAPRFGHRPPNTNGKPVLNVDTLRVLLTFNIAYDNGGLGLGRLRLQLTACYQLLCYTGVRPGELVDAQRKMPTDGSFEELFDSEAIQSANNNDVMDKVSIKVNQLLLQEPVNRDRPKALCYEDILFTIVRHPVTQQVAPAMAIKFVNHKGADKRPKPTIFFFTPTKKLIFDVVLTIAALALADKAFAAESITDALSLFQKRPWGTRDCIALRWKPEMLKIPVFRRTRDSALSANEAMLYSTLNTEMGQQSLDTGHEQKLTPRSSRRGAGNAANGDAPDTVRDQMMRHDPKFATFFNAYLNEFAKFDLQNAFLEEEKQVQLFRMFAHASLTRDPRASRNMVPKEVWENTPPDPDIVKLEMERDALKQGHYRIEGCANEKRIRQLGNDIRLMRAQRDRRIVKGWHEYYFQHRPTWDLDAQARGEVEEHFREPEMHTTIFERAELARILCLQPDDWTGEELLQHRIKVVHLMVAYCDKKEPRKIIKARPEAQASRSGGKGLKFIAASEPKLITASKSKLITSSEPALNLFPMLMKTTQCPDCIGDDKMPLMERTFEFCRDTVRNDHWEDRHLTGRERAEQRGEPIICKHPACGDRKFKHLDHFRAHVKSDHGVALRSHEQVLRRRLKKAKHREMVVRTRHRN